MKGKPSAALREIAPSDLSALETLHAAAFPGEGWSRLDFAKLLASPGVWGLLADGPSGAAGFALMRNAADEAEVLTLVVAPQCRRHGLGRQLLSAGSELAAAKGAVRLLLEVAADNLAARALYLSAGFAEVSRRPGYYGRGPGGACDALLLARKLDGPTSSRQPVGRS